MRCPKTTGDERKPAHEWCSSKKQINGSAVHITGIFGFTLAGLVIQDIVARSKAPTGADKQSSLTEVRDIEKT